MQTAFQPDAFQNDAFQIAATTPHMMAGGHSWKPLKIDFLNLDELRDMDDEEMLIIFSAMEML